MMRTAARLSHLALALCAGTCAAASPDLFVGTQGLGHVSPAAAWPFGMIQAWPDGCCGNDDSGQMAAWYVFSALGFYPVDPCGGEYVIGAPQVERVTIKLENVKMLNCGNMELWNYENGKDQSRNSIIPESHNSTIPQSTTFTVVARNLSKENKYVKSVKLNGKPVADWKIRHADIVRGGVLEFEMGPDHEQ